jgi:BREX system ATP-binding protein BrxC/D
MGLATGQEVSHPIYGSGVVIAIRDGGRVKVRFRGRERLPMTVPRRDLVCVEAAPEFTGAPTGKPGRPGGRPGRNGRKKSAAPARAAPPPKSLPPATPEEVADLRQTVEALRLGVVPRDYVRDYTVARERELSDFEGLLEAGRGLRLVWGDYGTGKTHLLDLYERMALKEGFVTTRVTLNPRETPPSHPQRLFREIVNSLRYPGIPGEGLDPLFLELRDSLDHISPGGSRSSRVLSPVLFASRHPETEVGSWAEDYIAGYPMDIEFGVRELRRIGWTGARPLALSDYRTYGRMYVHLVGTLAAWAGDAGFKGLVILFDEVEYVEMTRGESRNLAKEVLQHYAAITLPKEKLAFDPERLYRGGQAVHRLLPLRFDDEQRLAAVMALTPLPEAEAIAREILVDRKDDLELSRFLVPDFVELAESVARLYRRAYPTYALDESTLVRLSESAMEDLVLGDGSPRETVRRTVMELDADRLRAGPGRS